MADNHVELCREGVIAAMHNQIGPEGRGRPAGFSLDGRTAFIDGCQPAVQTLRCALVLHRKGADNAGTAASQNKLGTGGEKHRRGDQRQPETFVE